MSAGRRGDSSHSDGVRTARACWFFACHAIADDMSVDHTGSDLSAPGVEQRKSGIFRSMYTVIYLFPVPTANVDTFLRVQREAGKIYTQYGALSDETLEPLDLQAAYGCAGFADTLALKGNEDLYMGLSRFRDLAHHDEVMSKVDTDARIGVLYDEMLNVLEMPRVVRGAFAVSS